MSNASITPSWSLTTTRVCSPRRRRCTSARSWRCELAATFADERLAAAPLLRHATLENETWDRVWACLGNDGFVPLRIASPPPKTPSLHSTTPLAPRSATGRRTLARWKSLACLAARYSGRPRPNQQHQAPQGPLFHIGPTSRCWPQSCRPAAPTARATSPATPAPAGGRSTAGTRSASPRRATPTTARCSPCSRPGPGRWRRCRG